MIAKFKEKRDVNILEWAFGDEKMEDYFERRDGGWYIDTYKLKDEENGWPLFRTLPDEVISLVENCIAD